MFFILSQPVWGQPKSVLFVFKDVHSKQKVYPDSIRLDNRVFMASEWIQIEPGEHNLVVEKSGYVSWKEKILVSTDIAPILWEVELTPKDRPRKILFDVLEQEMPLLPFSLLINGKSYFQNHSFLPGTSIDILFQYQKFKTIQKTVLIPPGDGPYIVHLPLEKLAQYEIYSTQNKMDLDGIEYHYEFLADNDLIEKHQIFVEKGVKYFYYTLYVPQETKTFTICCGYFFELKPIQNLNSGIISMNHIHIPRLIKHLDFKRKEKSRGIIPVLENLLNQGYANSIAKSTEIKMLMEYLKECMKQSNSEEAIRIAAVMERIRIK
ncbi:MAG: hypothetical protein HUU50_08195 [Candidatus Brocadiae bacterium]|nr:hypothetical protein [Candidatus Brocadiia bacterium]